MRRSTANAALPNTGGRPNAEVAVQAWMESETHYDIIMTDYYTHMAAARFGNYWVVAFSG